jgi:hypothetical protein
MEQLKSRGVEFEYYEGLTDEDRIMHGISQKRGPDIAWFKDPAGNIISVLQEAGWFLRSNRHLQVVQKI